jgi:hypothetical protein
MSDEDLAAGSRWLPEVSEALSSSKVGILCVTSENQASPWLLFEAGALSKTIKDTFVCPILCGLTPGQLVGPLAQFHASQLDRDGIYRVLTTLNVALEERQLPDASLQRSFDVWWPQLEERLAKIPSLPEEKAELRPPGEMIDEVVTLQRELLRRENLRSDHARQVDARLAEVMHVLQAIIMASVDSQRFANSPLVLPPDARTGNPDGMYGQARKLANSFKDIAEMSLKHSEESSLSGQSGCAHHEQTNAQNQAGG